MKAVVLALALSFGATGAYAQTAAATSSCKATATEKKLAGAALKSFMTKCEKDAKASCDISAKEKKLAGAAKNSHVKKCVGDAVGT
ncbi:hypothetical protein GJW-30_1_03265 [Variibacter gotjawalensis]|jgi:hypothetical protein|uniref:PsiF repeat protein n=1 Tax=Variibacter gotjawalensis TaxID=1333996 RepID=A0A0S3PXN9_9BRAD|nr:hypothetical protein [Variibacter gotjawalensis]NIK46550.1 hypothetical protein [Variibacter gotjawalensis]RZS48455.1 hypothetical protein EV661_0868 [Variibacter gotjawalensis]BAT60716.1 hypothetical protein GJW-30_1_03265 [Variibacter gotjawalensis]